MISRRTLLVLISSAICLSCNEVYRKWEKDSFPSYSWPRDKALTFRPEIADVTYGYELVLGIRHIYGARINDIPLTVKIVSPSGREQVHELTLEVLGANGAPRSACAGDICDLEDSVTPLVFAEPGLYKFSINHHAPVGKIRGIMEFGVMIRKLDVDPDRGDD